MTGYNLSMGPQHPALPESERLVLKVDGEMVTEADIELGYMHRGIEELTYRKNYVQNIYLCERVCGICSCSHSTAYCTTIEKLLGLEVPERAQYIRTMVLEMERLHSHMLWAGLVAYEIGFDTLFHLVWRDREIVMELIEKLTGKRVNYGVNAIGGVRRDLPDAMRPQVIAGMDKLEKRVRRYMKIFTGDRMVRKRMEGVGVLSRADAIRLGLVGPLARASGLDFDVRKNDAYCAYDKVDFRPVIGEAGDVMSRAVVRLQELLESTRIVKHCVEKMPEGELKVRAPATIPANEAVSRIEAPRGELFYYVKSAGNDRPARVRTRTPTYANIIALKTILKGCQLADVPIITASIDPCFSCTDRMIVLDANTGQRTVASKYEFLGGKP
jgi:NADH-quinone oxidoreductase subunit D